MARITAADLNALLLDLDYKPADLARRLQVSDGTVSRWLKGARSPSGLYALEIERLIAQAAVHRDSEQPRSPADIRAIVNRVLAEIDATPEHQPATEYERGYLEGYRAAMTAVVGGLVTTALTERPNPNIKELTLERKH